MKCEVCGNEEANSFTFVNRKWFNAGKCSIGAEDYYIEHEQCASRDDLDHWIMHMREKRWFSEFAFRQCVRRKEKSDGEN